MILYLISKFALVLQFAVLFSLSLFLLLLLFFFLPCLFLVLLHPFCSAFEVSRIFTLLLCKVFHLFIFFYLFLYFINIFFFWGGGVSAKLMFGYNMGVFGGWWGPKLWIHQPGWRFWLCPVELANVPGWQMTTRHSFPRLGPNPRVITAVRRLGTFEGLWTTAVVFNHFSDCFLFGVDGCCCRCFLLWLPTTNDPSLGQKNKNIVRMFSTS